jgi:outer membrane protein insertion porin family
LPQAKAWKVEGIHFAVDSEEDIPFLHGLTNIKRGEEFSFKKVDDALSRLGQSGKFRYAEARVSESTKEIFFVLRSIYKIRKVLFNIESSDSKLSDLEIRRLKDDLRDEISIKNGDPVDLGQLSVVNAQTIQRLESRGYLDSEAITIFEEIPNSKLRDLIVNVSVSTPAFFSSLSFEGFTQSEEMQIINSYKDSIGANGFSQSDNARMDMVALNEVLEAYQSKIKLEGFFDSRVSYGADFESGEVRVSQAKGAKYRIDITGNVFFWERFLRDKVLQRVKNFSVPFDPNSVSTQISDFYKEYGFKDIQVTWKVDSKKTGTIDESHFLFSVDEGRQFYLGELIFLGGIGREESDDVNDASREWLMTLADPLHYTYFDERVLRSRVSELLNLIREMGYIEAKFVDIRFELREDSNRVDMLINLQIGQKFYVESIAFSGLSFVDEDVLQGFLSFEPGDPLRPSEIAAVNARIERYLQNNGFVDPKVELSEDLIFRKRPTLNRVDLVFQAESGPKVLVGKSVVEGNESTKDKVVLRELYSRTLESGSPWSQDGERRLRENLLALGIFGSVQTEKIAGRVVGVDPTHGFEIQQKDLKISLRERPAGSIEFGPGYRTDLGVIGFTEFNYRNVFGENYGFLTRAQVSRKIVNYQFLEQRYAITFLDPYFLSQRLRFRTSATYQKEDDRVYLQGADRGFSIEESNVSLNAEFLVSERWSWIQNVYTFSLPRLFGIKDSDATSRERSEKYRIGTVGSTLIYDGRDSIFNPTRGFYSVSSLEYASPFLGSNNDVNFKVFRQDFTQYYRTGPGSILAFSAEYARLWGRSNSERGVPANKRLFLGGQTSLRFLPEKALRFDDQGVQDQQSLEFKAEYRQPWIYDLSVAFFMDIGRIDVLAPTVLSDLSTGWRHGLGLGIRYATPVGPIALDFAFNLNPEENESNYQIQFSIGVF